MIWITTQMVSANRRGVLGLGHLLPDTLSRQRIQSMEVPDEAGSGVVGLIFLESTSEMTQTGILCAVRRKLLVLSAIVRPAAPRYA